MSATPSRRLFVTSALPYANGPFHIGHIMEYIQTDIWVRFQRMRGHDVHYRLRRRHARRADHAARRKPRASRPRQLIERVWHEHMRDFDGFRIGFDNDYSTHSPENASSAQTSTARSKPRD